MRRLIRLFNIAVLFGAATLSNGANAVLQTAVELEASQTVTFVPISVGDIFFVIPVGTGLPADPGEIGKFTIQGVDTDGDGIRDDVERNISQYYPNNGMARAYSYIVAMNYQRMIENSTSKPVQLQALQELVQVENCLDQLLANGEVKGSDLVLPWVLDTYQRSYAYIDALALMGGDALPAIAGCP